MLATDPVELQIDLDHENTHGRFRPFSTDEFYRFGHFHGLHDLVVETFTHWKVMKWPFYHEFLTVTTQPGKLISKGECSIPLVSMDSHEPCSLDVLGTDLHGISLRIERGRVSRLEMPHVTEALGSYQLHIDTVEIIPHNISPLGPPFPHAQSTYESLRSFTRKADFPVTPYSMRVRDIAAFTLGITEATPSYHLFRRNCWGLMRGLQRMIASHHFLYEFDVVDIIRLRREQRKRQLFFRYITRQWFSRPAGVHERIAIGSRLQKKMNERWALKPVPWYSPTRILRRKAPVPKVYADPSVMAEQKAEYDAQLAEYYKVFKGTLHQELGVDSLMVPDRGVWGYLLWKIRHPEDTSYYVPSRLMHEPDLSMLTFIKAIHELMAWFFWLQHNQSALPPDIDRLPTILQLLTSIPKSTPFAKMGDLTVHEYFETLFLVYAVNQQTVSIGQNMASIVIPQMNELLKLESTLSSRADIMKQICLLMGVLTDHKNELETMVNTDSLPYFLNRIETLGNVEVLNDAYHLIFRFCQQPSTSRTYIPSNPYVLLFIARHMKSRQKSPTWLINAAHHLRYLEPSEDHSLLHTNLIEYGVVAALLDLLCQSKWPVHHEAIWAVANATAFDRPLHILEHHDTSRAFMRVALDPPTPEILRLISICISYIVERAFMSVKDIQSDPTSPDARRMMQLVTTSGALEALRVLALPQTYTKMDADPASSELCAVVLKSVEVLQDGMEGEKGKSRSSGLKES